MLYERVADLRIIFLRDCRNYDIKGLIQVVTLIFELNPGLKRRKNVNVTDRNMIIFIVIFNLDFKIGSEMKNILCF